MSSTFSNLKFELIGTGEQQGLWGQTTNTNIGTAIEQAIVGMATLDSADFTANVATLTLANTNAAQDARALCLVVSASSLSAAGTINVPAIQKPYIIVNNDTYAVTVKVSGQTGVTVPAGKRSVVYNNGTDVGEQITYLTNLTVGALSLNTPLPVSAGGTGTATPSLVAGSNVSVSGSWPNQTVASFGSVSTTSVVSANGFAGTVANASTTPAITLSTSVTGLVKGNGTAISAASAGTDYVAPTVATNFTALQTFSGTSASTAMKMLNAKEAVTISATAATGTINYDVTTQSVLYYTTAASANWTVNFRASSGTSLDAVMSVGESVTVAFLVTQGATARYNSAVQVDGSSVTPKWQGGAAPTSGNANSIDVYTYTLIKTGTAAFTVLAVQARFA